MRQNLYAGGGVDAFWQGFKLLAAWRSNWFPAFLSILPSVLPGCWITTLPIPQLSRLCSGFLGCVHSAGAQMQKRLTLLAKIWPHGLLNYRTLTLVAKLARYSTSFSNHLSLDENTWLCVNNSWRLLVHRSQGQVGLRDREKVKVRSLGRGQLVAGHSPPPLHCPPPTSRTPRASTPWRSWPRRPRPSSQGSVAVINAIPIPFDIAPESLIWGRDDWKMNCVFPKRRELTNMWNQIWGGWKYSALKFRNSIEKWAPRCCWQ